MLPPPQRKAGFQSTHKSGGLRKTRPRGVAGYRSSSRSRGSRSRSVCTAIRASRRARWAPRQKCGPCAKASWRFAFGLRIWNVSGSSNIRGSRFAPASDTVTWSPALIRAPLSCVSRVAYRSTTAAAGSSRSDSSTAAGISPRSARTSSSSPGEESRCNMAFAIMPSVVSMPPNSRTPALEMASSSVSNPVTSASSDAWGAAMTWRRLAASSANAAVPVAAVPVAAAPIAAAPEAAASAWTAATMPSYQLRI